MSMSAAGAYGVAPQASFAGFAPQMGPTMGAYPGAFGAPAPMMMSEDAIESQKDRQIDTNHTQFESQKNACKQQLDSMVAMLESEVAQQIQFQTNQLQHQRDAQIQALQQQYNQMTMQLTAQHQMQQQQISQQALQLTAQANQADLQRKMHQALYSSGTSATKADKKETPKKAEKAEKTEKADKKDDKGTADKKDKKVTPKSKAKAKGKAGA